MPHLGALLLSPKQTLKEAFMLPMPSRLKDRIVDREVMRLQLREANLRAADARRRDDAKGRRQPTRPPGVR